MLENQAKADEYKYTDTTAQIQIQKYKYTSTKNLILQWTLENLAKVQQRQRDRLTPSSSVEWMDMDGRMDEWMSIAERMDG